MSVEPVNPQSVALAAELLNKGRLVAFPTETVYGLGADAGNDLAVASIFEAKGRPQFNPLIAHIADLSWTERFAVLTDSARVLAEKFWPGPLTMVMKRTPGCPISHLVSAGLDTVGVRFPAHPAARQMIAAFGRPVACRAGTGRPRAADFRRRRLCGRGGIDNSGRVRRRPRLVARRRCGRGRNRSRSGPSAAPSRNQSGRAAVAGADVVALCAAPACPAERRSCRKRRGFFSLRKGGKRYVESQSVGRRERSRRAFVRLYAPVGRSALYGNSRYAHTDERAGVGDQRQIKKSGLSALIL